MQPHEKTICTQYFYRCSCTKYLYCNDEIRMWKKVKYNIKSIAQQMVHREWSGSIEDLLHLWKEKLPNLVLFSA